MEDKIIHVVCVVTGYYIQLPFDSPEVRLVGADMIPLPIRPGTPPDAVVDDIYRHNPGCYVRMEIR